MYEACIRYALALTALLAFLDVERASPQLERVAVMTAPRAAHTATALRGGTVLIAGGCTVDGCEADARSGTAETYDPATRTFHATGPLLAPRLGHAAVRLRDGRVLLLGGWTGRVETATAELYHPHERRFVGAASMREARSAFTATLLRDGRVLVAGGTRAGASVSMAELYDPRSDRFSPTRPMRHARSAHAAVLLADGRVLVTGGAGAGRARRSAEIYDPRRNVWKLVRPLVHRRHKHGSVRLPNGRVLVVGGSDERDWRGRHATAEEWAPRSNRWTVLPLNEARFKLADAVVPLSGGALVAGGGRIVERFDAERRRFGPVARLPRALMFSTATYLPDGAVLVAGGYDEQIAVTRAAWVVRAS